MPPFCHLNLNPCSASPDPQLSQPRTLNYPNPSYPAPYRHVPLVLRPFLYAVPPFWRLMNWLRPGRSMGLRVYRYRWLGQGAQGTQAAPPPHTCSLALDTCPPPRLPAPASNCAHLRTYIGMSNPDPPSPTPTSCSPFLRYITFKLYVDLKHMPALRQLVSGGMRVLLSGDTSEWERAVQMP